MKATLYHKALVLSDTVVSKYSSLLPSDAADTVLSPRSNVVESSTSDTRKRSRDLLSADDENQQTKMIAQIALYKTEALLALDRTDDALLCIDRSVSLLLTFLRVSSSGVTLCDG